MLSLRNQLKQIPISIHKIKPKGSKTFSLLALATLISSVNWYLQKEILKNKNEYQDQLINRVSNNKTKQQCNFNIKIVTNTFKLKDIQDWNCNKVKVDGILLDGRFIVKRNRGGQQGYFVLAPFLISRLYRPSKHYTDNFQRTVILNLGWIPKGSKHLIPKTVAPDTIGQNDYSSDLIAARNLNLINKDNLQRAAEDPDLYNPVTTVEAYVRKGEQINIPRGYNNWVKQTLFKFIDLNYITRAFRIANFHQSSQIYLERTLKQDEESENLPLPVTQDQLIADLKDNIQWNQKQTSINIKKFTGGAFAAAILLALI